MSNPGPLYLILPRSLTHDADRSHALDGRGPTAAARAGAVRASQQGAVEMATPDEEQRPDLVLLPRDRTRPWRQPTPEQIRASRQRRGHTIAQAADTIDVARVTWEKWEAGINPMHPAYWLAYHLRS